LAELRDLLEAVAELTTPVACACMPRKRFT
jgi:hypothetical protein